MTKAQSPSAQRYVVRFTIRDGEHEYRQTTTQNFRGHPTEQLVVYALIDLLRYEDGDLATLQRTAWKQYQQGRYLEIPGDYRLVDDITWELEQCPCCHMTPCACIPVGDEQATACGLAQLMVTTGELAEAIVRLLECPDLNVDELGEITVEAIANARCVIAKTQGGA